MRGSSLRGHSLKEAGDALMGLDTKGSRDKQGDIDIGARLLLAVAVTGRISRPRGQPPAFLAPTPNGSLLYLDSRRAFSIVVNVDRFRTSVKAS